MFRSMKNIDTAFRNTRLVSILAIAGAVLISLFIIYRSYRLASRSQDRIYVLVNGKALEAYASDRKDNIPVEARDHVKMFHHYFFTLSPDDNTIKVNLTRALYLADESAKRQYDNLRESNYYAEIISGNVDQTVQVDSIQLDMDQYPYYFRCYALQELTRSTSIVQRKLITEGFLRNVSRSDNNSHGLLIERWGIIENSDLSIKNR